MMENKDKISYNSKGERHGYWETYYNSGKLDYKGNYVNGKKDGDWEEYHEWCGIRFIGNYTNGLKIGVWKTYHHEKLVNETYHA